MLRNIKRAGTGFLTLLLALSFSAEARQPRSAAAKAEFKRSTPCPETGQHRGKCPGYVVDHIDPLCNGGLDTAANMQWQTLAESKAKDRLERDICRK